jgi:hypothetical protein
LALRDGVTNEWQIFDPFGSLTHGVYATRRVPEVESVFLCVFGLALLFLIRRRSPSAGGHFGGYEQDQSDS